MIVKLINTPDLSYIDKSIGMCYDKGCYTGERMHNRIQRVANVNKHSSVLEFTDAIFEITAACKVLLELTRHRQASYACKSSRFTLNKGEIIFESTGDAEIDEHLEIFRDIIQEQADKGKSNDVVSLMLPQAYQYRWTAKFNYRSLQNFFSLRRDKHAHFMIQDVANAMFEALPDEHKYLFE